MYLTLVTCKGQYTSHTTTNPLTNCSYVIIYLYYRNIIYDGKILTNSARYPFNIIATNNRLEMRYLCKEL